MYVTKINETKAMNWKDIREAYMEKLEARMKRGKRYNYIII